MLPASSSKSCEAKNEEAFENENVSWFEELLKTDSKANDSQDAKIQST